MCAQSQGLTAYPPVNILNTEVRSLTSKIVEGMEYLIYVAFPEGYKSSSEHYPALYLLDAFDRFGTVVEAYRLYRVFNIVPKLVLIGISHTGRSLQDDLFYRSRDFIPTKLSVDEIKTRYGAGMASLTPISGGASKFLQFIKDELFPFVESEYRLDPSYRGLFGYSYGGLFVMHVLFNMPQLFQRYFVGSAAGWWDNYVVFDDETRYAKEHTMLPVKVFASVGSKESDSMLENFERLRNTLKQRDYKGLELTATVFEGEDHLTCCPLAHVHAMRELYRE